MATMGIPTPGLQVEISAEGRHLQETITVQVPTETLSSSACKPATSAPSKTVAQVSQSFKYDDERFRREARSFRQHGAEPRLRSPRTYFGQEEGIREWLHERWRNAFLSLFFFFIFLFHFLFFFIAFPAR